MRSANVKKLPLMAGLFMNLGGLEMIVVMNRGEIVQQGTYEELASQDGLCAEMARRQTV